MEVRRQVEEHEVVVSASTADGKLAVGNPPNLGYLLINVPAAEMNFPGEYVGDIVASDEIYSRVAVQFTLQIVTGITRNP
jgi:hypothetical protein